MVPIQAGTRRIPMAVAALAAAASAACAPLPLARAGPSNPAPAAASYVLVDDVAATVRRLLPLGRDTIVGATGSVQTLAYLRADRESVAMAEIHDAADDYHLVLEGSASYTLGGRLESPREVSPGEWRADRIVDGRVVVVNRGDLIFLPRGVAHQMDTRGHEYSFMVIKVFADPIPAASR